MNNTEQIMNGISHWLSNKIDELSSNNIWLALAANPIKRVAGEYICKIIPIDILQMLLSKNGVINADIFADEVICAIKNAPEITQEFKGGYSITVKDGVISFIMPDNGIIKTLLNGDNVINIREEDIKDLARCINYKYEQ